MAKSPLKQDTRGKKPHEGTNIGRTAGTHPDRQRIIKGSGLTARTLTSAEGYMSQGRETMDPRVTPPAGSAFTMRSGNSPMFKHMGSSPMTQGGFGPRKIYKKDFGKAFSRARQLGLETFQWKDPETKEWGEFHTKTKEETQPEKTNDEAINEGGMARQITEKVAPLDKKSPAKHIRSAKHNRQHVAKFVKTAAQKIKKGAMSVDEFLQGSGPGSGAA